MACESVSKHPFVCVESGGAKESVTSSASELVGAETAEFFRQLRERLEAQPGVEHVGW